MANRSWRAVEGSLTHKLVFLTGILKLGAAGAVGTSIPGGRGFQVVHSGTGLYTVTLEDFYTELQKCVVTLMDGASLTAAKASAFFLVKASNTIEATTPGKTFTVQGYRTDTLANAVPADNAELRFEIGLKNSIVT